MVLSHEKFTKYKLGLMCGFARANYPCSCDRCDPEPDMEICNVCPENIKWCFNKSVLIAHFCTDPLALNNYSVLGAGRP